MLLLRLVTTALCAACVVMLASSQPIRIEVAPAALRHRVPPGTAVVRVRANAPCTVAALPAPPDPPSPSSAPPLGSGAVQVVDVARGVPPARIASLIALAPGEYIAAIDRPRDATRGGVNGPAVPVQRGRESPLLIDHAPGSDLEAGAMIASLPHPGEYLDLTVGIEGDDSVQRRVLVLLH